MSYRVLCDENVEPATVGELEAEGNTATHVNNQPGVSSPDPEVAEYAGENLYVLLTNDDDFLGGTFPEVTVLFFPDNRASAHQLTARIVELRRYYPKKTSPTKCT